MTLRAALAAGRKLLLWLTGLSACANGWSQMEANATPRPEYELKALERHFPDNAAQALLKAAMAGDAAAAKAALVAGAALDAEDPGAAPPLRLRPLHYAIAARSATAARILVQLGADPERDAPELGSALIFAITLDFPAVLGGLLDGRPFAQMKPETQRDVLFRTVSVGRPACLEVLLARGAPVDLRDSRGSTPMMAAIDAFDVPMALMLLEKGASAQVETRAGVTPANQVQSLGTRVRTGSEQFQQLKDALEARGAVFPAPTPQQVRAARARP